MDIEIYDATTRLESDDEKLPEKDATELELERIIFGDNVGFQDALKEHARHDLESDDDVGEALDDEEARVDVEGRSDEENDLAGLGDADASPTFAASTVVLYVHCANGY